MSKIKHPNSMLGLGVALGAGIGVAMDNLAVGVAIGLSLGLAFRQRLVRQANRQNQK